MSLANDRRNPVEALAEDFVARRPCFITGFSCLDLAAVTAWGDSTYVEAMVVTDVSNSCRIAGKGRWSCRQFTRESSACAAQGDRRSRCRSLVRLQAGVDELGKEIDALRDAQREAGSVGVATGCPDLSQRGPLRAANNEFYNVKEIPVAKKLLEQGLERVQQLRAGKAPWNEAAGLVVRGYVSRIDGSVQPYGLVVPPSYQANTPYRFRLDVWCHGRGENLSELNFLNGRQTCRASSRRRTHSSSTPTAAIVMPTNSLARSTCSRRSTTSRNTTRSTKTAW